MGTAGLHPPSMPSFPRSSANALVLRTLSFPNNGAGLIFKQIIRRKENRSI